MNLIASITVFLALASAMFVSGCGGNSSHGVKGNEESHFGDRMQGIGRRFERLGRAGVARRWDFARYEVHEIRESIDELKKAPVPDDLTGLDVAQLTHALSATALPALDSALARQDSVQFRQAFRQTAEQCNACHETARRRFVQVPTEPGEEVPVLTPLPGRP